MEPTKKNIDTARKLFTQRESLESQINALDKITLKGKYEIHCINISSGSFVLPNSEDFDYIKILIANKVKEYYQDKIESIDNEIKTL